MADDSFTLADGPQHLVGDRACAVAGPKRIGIAEGLFDCGNGRGCAELIGVRGPDRRQQLRRELHMVGPELAAIEDPGRLEIARARDEARDASRNSALTVLIGILFTSILAREA